VLEATNLAVKVVYNSIKVSAFLSLLFPLVKEAFQNSIQEKYERIEVRECLLSFGAESFVFHFAIQKCKDSDMQNYNFACCFVWM